MLWGPSLLLPSPSPSAQRRSSRTCASATRSTLLPSSGLPRACPSLCQVMLGGGVPWAAQRSSKGAPRVSNSSAGWPESSMWGGSARHPARVCHMPGAGSCDSSPSPPPSGSRPQTGPPQAGAGGCAGGPSEYRTPRAPLPGTIIRALQPASTRYGGEERADTNLSKMAQNL